MCLSSSFVDNSEIDVNSFAMNCHCWGSYIAAKCGNINGNIRTPPPAFDSFKEMPRYILMEKKKKGTLKNWVFYNNYCNFSKLNCLVSSLQLWVQKMWMDEMADLVCIVDQSYLFTIFRILWYSRTIIYQLSAADKKRYQG